MSWLKKNKYLITLIFIIVTGISVVKYIYKPHRNIEKIQSVYVGNCKDFYKESLNKIDQWQDKIITLTGTISSSDLRGIMLEDKIYCQFKDSTISSTLKHSDKITIKGRIIGFDNLLEEIKLDKCIIIK
jgi:hypothetical protein